MQHRLETVDLFCDSVLLPVCSVQNIHRRESGVAHWNTSVQTSSLHVSALATGNLDRMSFGGQNYHGGQNPGLDIWSYMARLGVQMRGAGDDFFAEGDGVCAMRTCQYMTQVDIEELLHDDFTEFSCQAPGCKAKFKQLIDSEAHYNAKHRHSCQECKKNLPSAHLLDLHIAESHDTYFSVSF